MSTSSFLVSKFKTERLFLSLINVERVLLIRLCKPSMFATTFSSKLGSRFFFPLGNLSLCNSNHDSDQLPSVTPTQAISPMGALGETSSVTEPNVLFLGSVEPLIRFELVYLKQIFGTGFAWAESLLDTIRGKQCLDLEVSKIENGFNKSRC